jgi:hypothetical protein
LRSCEFTVGVEEISSEVKTLQVLQGFDFSWKFGEAEVAKVQAASFLLGLFRDQTPSNLQAFGIRHANSVPRRSNLNQHASRP